MDDFSKYVSLKAEKIDPLGLYLAAKKDGLDAFARIRMLREVYEISLDEAKKISFKGDTGEDIDEQKGKHAEDFKNILDDELGLDDL